MEISKAKVTNETMEQKKKKKGWASKKKRRPPEQQGMRRLPGKTISIHVVWCSRED